MKAYISLFLIMYIVAQPSHAYAGFFSDLLTKVLGSETQASEVKPIGEDNVIHNSQNVPLLESSINPDVKNIKDDAPLPKEDDDTLLSSNGSLGIDSDLEKYASTEKIITYTVKKGDTLLGISNRLKVPQATILASNGDLKKSDFLKIGQKLVILGTKDTAPVLKIIDADTSKSEKTDVIAKKDEKPKTPIKEPVANKEEPKVKETPVVALTTPVIAVTSPSVDTTVTAPTVMMHPVVEDAGQPKGTINGGYIWPFPSGKGRISQGLHADQAYDFAAPKDTPILAIQSGTVFVVHPTGYNGGYGKYVVINFDDGRQAIFGHMNRTNVDEGQVVKQGDVIGFVGTTGQSTGYHTHIGFRGGLGNPYKGLKVNSTSIEGHD